MDGRQARGATPPPVIGKAGRYTVFITPPATPKPPEAPRTSSPRSIARNEAPLPTKAPPSPPPVQVPPRQFDKPAIRSSGSLLGIFWEAVAKVQDVHSSMDEFLADWLGLNQSKYQWALNDYYENNGVEKEGNSKELLSKGQDV